MTRNLRAAPIVKIYRVGGSVRDELLGAPGADRDWVVVGATPEMLIASGYRPVGRDFPGVPASRDARGIRARAHRAQERARLPRLRVLRVARRDARAGPRAARPDDQRDGARRGRHADRSLRRRGDLRAGVLRHVSPAFAEDPLRVLRVARFAARFGFAVAPETRGADARASRPAASSRRSRPSASGRSSRGA